MGTQSHNQLPSKMGNNVHAKDGRQMGAGVSHETL